MNGAAATAAQACSSGAPEAMLKIGKACEDTDA